MLLRPEWNRACGDCRKWVYEDGDGVPGEKRGLPVLRQGERLDRPLGSPTPCYKCVKVPDSVRRVEESAGRRVTSRDAIEPDDWHRLVVERVMECHAVGSFPADGWMRRWAAIVRPIILQAEQRNLRDLVSLLTVQATTQRRV